MNGWEVRLQHSGARYDICFLVQEGRCPVEEFLEELDRSDPATSKKVAYALDRLASSGIPRNDEYCKQLEADLWELRRGQARLFFFIRGRSLVSANGYKKKRDRLSKEELNRARRIRDGYNRHR